MASSTTTSFIHQSFVRTVPSLTDDNESTEEEEEEEEDASENNTSGTIGIGNFDNHHHNKKNITKHSFHHRYPSDGTIHGDDGDDGDDDESCGPVTLLARRAAAQDTMDRQLRQQQQQQQQHRHEQRIQMQATAMAVGEVAYTIAKVKHSPTAGMMKSNSLSPPPNKLFGTRRIASSSNDDGENNITLVRPTARQTSPSRNAPQRRQMQRQPQHTDHSICNVKDGTDDDDDDDDDHDLSCDEKNTRDDNNDNDESTSEEVSTTCDVVYRRGGDRGIVEMNGGDDSPEMSRKDYQHPSSWMGKMNHSHGDNFNAGGGCSSNHSGGGGFGGGLFASAKHWLQSQRDRLHQLELERQVEDQRRKLVEEGRKQRAREAEERRKRAHRCSKLPPPLQPPLDEHTDSYDTLHKAVSNETKDCSAHGNTTPTTIRNDGTNRSFHPQQKTVDDHHHHSLLPMSIMSSSEKIQTPSTTLFLPPTLQDELCIVPQFHGELCHLSSQQHKRLLSSNDTEDESSSSLPLPNSYYHPSTTTTTTTTFTNTTRSSFMCGFGGVYNTELDDDSLVAADYPAVARVDSYGNILEMIPSGSSLDDENDEIIPHVAAAAAAAVEEGRLGVVGKRKVYMSVSSPRWTCSGEGMTVKVDMDDFNDDSTCDDDDDDDNNKEQEGEGEEEEGIDTNNNTRSHHNDWICNQSTQLTTGYEDNIEDDPYFSDIKIVPETPRDESSSDPSLLPILQESHMKSLILSGGLPPSLGFCKWKRLYSLTRDGDSFEHFLHRVEGHDRTVLVVKTTMGSVFGGYADSRWEARHLRRHASEYYGSAQAFLFRFPNYGCNNHSRQNEPLIIPMVDAHRDGKCNEKEEEEEEEEMEDVVIYKWSGANRYIQLCDASRRMIALGGGGEDGDFGLCIEDDFRRGTSGHCSTFNNEALCEEGYFSVMDLEAWGFILDF